MPQQLVTRIKRGPLEGLLYQERNSFFVKVARGGRVVKENSEPFYDQEEAEVELGAMLDDVWKETSLTHNKKTVRRL